MSYGIQVFSNDGRTVFDTSTITWIYIDSFRYFGGNGIYRDYTNLEGFREAIYHIQPLSPPASDRPSYLPPVSYYLHGIRYGMLSVHVSSDYNGNPTVDSYITIYAR